MGVKAVLTSGGLSFLRDWLAGLNPAPPTFVGFGTGTAPASRFLSEIPDETFRTAIGQSDATEAQVIFHAVVDVADNLDNQIGCYGIIAGDATNQTGTGTVIAVGNDPVPFEKTAINTLSIDLAIPVSGFLGPTATVTSGGIALIRNFLAGQSPSPPQFLAVGTGSPFGFFDSVPPSEAFRVPIIQADCAGQSVTFRAWVEPSTGGGTVATCLGIMAGSASKASGTGTAVALCSTTFTKGTTEARTIIANVTLSGTVN